MTAFDYTRTLATANRLIERFGQLGAVRRPGTPTGPSYDPTPGTPTDDPARFVITAYMAREVDGTRVLSSDVKVLMAPGGLLNDPTTNDKVIAGSTEYMIVDVSTLAPAGVAVLYTLQCRR